MRLLVICLVVSFAALPTARADNGDPIDALGVAAVTVEGMIVAGETLPLVLGTVDLAARPTSRWLGAIELFDGGVMVTVNAVFAREAARSDHRGFAGLFGALALVDAAVAAHGAYVVFHRKAAPSPLRLGAARGYLAPTLVSDGRAAAPGLGVSARW